MKEEDRNARVKAMKHKFHSVYLKHKHNHTLNCIVHYITLHYNEVIYRGPKYRSAKPLYSVQNYCNRKQEENEWETGKFRVVSRKRVLNTNSINISTAATKQKNVFMILRENVIVTFSDSLNIT